MIEALRGLGYSTSTALADVIDNSIAAQARNVDLLFNWRGAGTHIRVVDDGRGMTAEELDLAMRLGEKNPLEKRAAGDLGRFGLGLKTASFSQARRLTVASRRGGQPSCLRWDLDVIAQAKDDGWYMFDGPHPGSEQLLDVLPPTGTVVIWEMLDRIVTPGFAEQSLLNLIDTIEAHLAMVFHRYLEGPRPRLTLRINGRTIVPWDPFLRANALTWPSPLAKWGDGDRRVEAQSFVLPHRDRLAPADYDRAAGPDGWTAQQGFYVYRNERLLLAGSWLGLGDGKAWTKDEACRLARIRLDLPNTLDSDWKIDIRKSVARPPTNLRGVLTHLAEDARARARRVFAHRGQAQRAPGREPVVMAWRAEHLKSGIRYRIDQDHPAIAAVVSQAGPLGPELQAMLRVIEETVPVQRIWLDTAEARETPRTGFGGTPDAEVSKVLKVMYRSLTVRKGLTPERAIETLMNTEPFQDYPALVAALAD